jgi:DNA invertase Pin-like site-specific DNA recombinase
VDLVAKYVETESGRKADRPKLGAALSHAKAIGAKLVFAKLDRLTRNLDLLRSLVASNVDLVFCDLPSVPPGPMGKFLLTQMASVAELEAGLIGERTKKALAAAKARGVKLGNRRPPCAGARDSSSTLLVLQPIVASSRQLVIPKDIPPSEPR